jgi:acyl-coenzyme A synthetase/AMP-(fatty) acid ligase
VPIGRPIANTTNYILDRHLKLVPPGVIGDLYIGGDGLARGYHNRADLTAERFIPNPFAANPDGRLYATGDRARFREDGNIEFLGRGDRQVKIRGFRIEPGEIEACLRDHPLVSDAAILFKQDRDDKRLAAFLVPDLKATTTSVGRWVVFRTGRRLGRLVRSIHLQER